MHDAMGVDGLGARGGGRGARRARIAAADYVHDAKGEQGDYGKCCDDCPDGKGLAALRWQVRRASGSARGWRLPSPVRLRALPHLPLLRLLLLPHLLLLLLRLPAWLLRLP